MIDMTVQEQVTGRKACEEFVRKCRLAMPEEVADLFEAYTRWIWQYKCPGAIYKYYCDQTAVYGANGVKSVGADDVVANTLVTRSSAACATKAPIPASASTDPAREKAWRTRR